MIKIRVFDKRYNKYLPQHTVDNMLWGALNSNDYIIELATGAKDNKGKDIYVGDIVEYFCDYNSVVKRKNGYFYLYSRDDSHYNVVFDHTTLSDIDFKVISNIHENKELLE